MAHQRQLLAVVFVFLSACMAKTVALPGRYGYRCRRWPWYEAAGPNDNSVVADHRGGTHFRSR